MSEQDGPVNCCSSCHDEVNLGYQDFPSCCRLNHRHQYEPREAVINGRTYRYCFCEYDEDDDVHVVGEKP